MTFRDVSKEIERWKAAGEPVALATVVRTWGSGPRGPGAKMALTEDARIAGSVSGGCVEAAVIEEGREVLSTGAAKLLHFGVSDETAWTVGLTCGGATEILVEKLDPGVLQAFAEAERTRSALARAVTIRGGEVGRTLLIREGERASSEIERAALRALEQGQSEVVTAASGEEVFLDVELPPPSIVMIGGVHIS
ncbi:MAG TPA: XdhC family protein, partial [Vicinamibacteria bacterium]